MHGELAGLGITVARPRSGRSSRAPGSTRRRAEMGRAGGVPAVPGPGDPGAGLLHRRPAQRDQGLRPGRDRARHPPDLDPWRHGAPGPGVGGRAGPEPAHGPGRCRHEGEVRLHDRDASFTATFDAALQAGGARVVRCAVQAPRMNSVMERWIGGCRRELLDRTLVWNTRRLMSVLREYEDFYNTHRPAPRLEPGRAASPGARWRYRPGPLPRPAARPRRRRDS